MTAAGIVLTLSCVRKARRPEKPVPTASVVLTGDVMLDRGVRIQIQRIGMEGLLQDVSSIFRASDFTVINLECPATDTIRPQEKPYVFRAEPEWIPVLVKAGITHASLANNHSVDQNEVGLVSTLSNLNRYGIVPFGAGTDSLSCSPVIFGKSGIAFALFGSAPLYQDYKSPDLKNVKPCIESAEETAVRIRAEKRRRPGMRIFAFLHWGKEYVERPSKRQQEGARLLIDAGAEAVVGHHPHVLQPVEWYKGKPIFYSLGNLVFDQRKPPTNKGMVVRLTYDPDSLRTIELYPVAIERGVPMWVTESDTGRPVISLPDSSQRFVVRYKPD